MAEIKEDLIQNFIDLQDVLSNLALKIDELTLHISKLLKLFEESAKSFQENSKGEDDEFYGAVKTLLDQNKIIAKSISIIEERIRTSPPQYPQSPYPQPRPASDSRMTPSLSLTRPSSSVSDIKPRHKPLPTENG